jgi:chemotaxis protein methyltransferase CheR
MLLHETFPIAKSWDVRVTGTDLSKKMVERGRKACYSQIEVGRGLPSQLLVKYFERVGTEWQVREELRKRTEWKTLNLTRFDAKAPEYDVIFLRNVLIYFNPETRARADLRGQGAAP